MSKVKLDTPRFLIELPFFKLFPPTQCNLQEDFLVGGKKQMT